MIKNMSISETRNKLTSLHGELRSSGDTVAVTSRGNPVLALLNWDLYESITETLAIMSDPDLVKALQQSIREAKAGKTVSLEDVKKEFL